MLTVKWYKTKEATPNTNIADPWKIPKKKKLSNTNCFPVCLLFDAFNIHNNNINEEQKNKKKMHIASGKLPILRPMNEYTFFFVIFYLSPSLSLLL